MTWRETTTCERCGSVIIPVTLQQERDDARAQLAAANALLVRHRRYVRDDCPLAQDTDAHLAAQPTTAPARTDSEQRVLDAMANVPEHELRWHAAPTTPMMHPCRAELARREAK